jgi:hypothetical protein
LIPVSIRSPNLRMYPKSHRAPILHPGGVRLAPGKPKKNGGSRVESLHRHQRKCVICNHLEREMIEFYFINWRSPYKIASDFRISNTSAVYRHARALDLFLQRSQNIRAMLEILFEKACGAKLTADALVRAVRTYASLGENGEWIEPATTHVISFPASTRHQQPLPSGHSGRPEFGSAGPERLLSTTVSASRKSDSSLTLPQKRGATAQV